MKIIKTKVKEILKKVLKVITLITAITIIGFLILAGVGIRMLTVGNSTPTKENKVSTGGMHEEKTITVEESLITDDFTWSELSVIAKKISDGASDITTTLDENDKITQVKGTINNKSFELNVGDKGQVKYNSDLKIVRILGFKHDDLTIANEYGGTNETKAGISFEFVDLIGYNQMNADNTNENGWGKSLMRKKLNDETEQGNYLPNLIDQTANNTTTKMTSYIKAVDKKYLKQFDSTNTADVVTPKEMSQTYDTITAGDKLWLLSCSEIWVADSNGLYGFCKQKEGEQYAFYSEISGLSSGTSYNKLMKPNIRLSTSWWLRSPRFGDDDRYFCRVGMDGNCHIEVAGALVGCAPGFSI